MTRSEARQYRDHINRLIDKQTDEDALTNIDLFEPWKANTDYASGKRVQDEGLLYACIQAHRSQGDWKPAITPALWKLVTVEEWPEWVQPIGAHDAYEQGAKVSHNGKHWISLIDANVYEPGVTQFWLEA